jgi:hypothetical protein
VSALTTDLHHVCPFCLCEHDAASGVGDAAHRTPAAGSVSFCIECGRFSMFDERLQLREPHPAELAAILADPQAWALFETWAIARARKGGRR